MKIEITLDSIAEMRELGAYLCAPAAKEPVVWVEAKKVKHKAPDADPEPVKEPEESTEPVPVPDLKDVRAITIALKDHYSNEERKALIVKYGGTSASNIPESNRVAYIAEAKKMLEGANE